MPYIEISDATLFFAHRHRGARHDLVLVHGAGGEHTVWGYQLAHIRLANTYALDLPGHGRSSGHGRLSIADYVVDVCHMLDALGLERAIIAGDSMGGAVAQALALSHPPRVAGLILVSSGARLRVAPALLESLEADFERAVQMLVALAYGRRAAPEVVERGRQKWLKSRPKVMAGDFAACNAFDVTGRLGEIACPVLVICGAEDQLTPVKYARYLREHIPNAELVLIEEAGHMVVIEQAAEVSRAMAEFLARPWWDNEL